MERDRIFRLGTGRDSDFCPGIFRIWPNVSISRPGTGLNFNSREAVPGLCSNHPKFPGTRIEICPGNISGTTKMCPFGIPFHPYKFHFIILSISFPEAARRLRVRLRVRIRLRRTTWARISIGTSQWLQFNPRRNCGRVRLWWQTLWILCRRGKRMSNISYLLSGDICWWSRRNVQMELHLS